MPQQKQNRFWRRWLTRLLISRLRTKSAEVRTYILQALGKIGDESALPVILDAVGDSDSTIRRFAVDALADLEDMRGVDALINALNDTETDIRVAAATALGRLLQTAGRTVLSQQDNSRRALSECKSAESALIALLDDEEISARAQAVIALGNLRSNQALPLLNQMMAAESNEWMRRYISQAIKDIEGGYSS